MEYLCHHIMDLAENSTAAGASLVEILLREDIPADTLSIEVKDDGRGMTPEMIVEVNEPLGQLKHYGLGLTLFARACEEAAGKIVVESVFGKGAQIRGTMRYSHEDRGAIGDLGETLITLIMGSPGVNWVLRHEIIKADGSRGDVLVDTRAIRVEVANAPLTHPEVIRRIRVAVRQQELQLKD